MSNPNEDKKAEIDKLVREAYAAIKLAEELAKEADYGFSFDLAYGMGGYFDPSEGWCPSSQSC